MAGEVLIRRQQRWNCPNCNVVDVTYEARPHTRFHSCLGLGNLTAPLIEAGVKAEVRAVEREDYVGNEKGLVFHNGKPIMSVVTEREDGQDAVVFAPTAQARLSDG